MSRPELATEIAGLRRFLMQGYNKQVRDDFRDDITLDVGDWNTWSEEQQLLYLLQIKPNDTEGRMLLRMLTFMFVRGGASVPVDAFAIPVDNYLEDIKLKPQIQLVFLEKPSDQRQNNRHYPLRLKLSIRIRQEVSQITKGEINVFLDRILRAFATPLYAVDKGRNMYSYVDNSKGYRLKLFLANIADAKALIDKALSIQGDDPDWGNLAEAARPDENWINPGSENVLGKLTARPKRRIPGRVYLRRVELLLPPAKPKLIAKISPAGGVTRLAL